MYIQRHIYRQRRREYNIYYLNIHVVNISIHSIGSYMLS